MIIFKQYFSKYLPQTFVAVALLAAETLADLYQPLLISKLIDEGISNQNIERVKEIGLMMIGVAFIGLMCTLGRNYMSTHISFGFGRDLRGGLYAKLLTLNMIQIEDVERGSIINRLTFDVQQIQHFVNGSMRIFLKAPLLALGSFFMVLQLDRRFFYIYLVVVPLILILIVVNVNIGYPLFAKIQVELDKLNKKTIEYLNGIRVVKAFNRSKYENDNFDKVNEELMHVTSKAFKVMAVFNPLNMLVVNMAVVSVLFLSKSWMSNSSFGVGQIVAFVNYMTQLLFAISIMSRIFNMYIRAKTSNQRVVEILNMSVNNQDVQQASPFNHLLNEEDFNKGIKIENLSYKFGEGDFALNHINLDIPYGKSLGIIGATGSGKTTLAHLLIGLLEPSEGAIYIGNKKLDSANIDSFRALAGYVPQEKILFSDTVINNIKIGNDQLDDEEYIQLIKQVSGEFIFDMTENWDTKLGKGGVNISGGQKQRISLARALARQPKVIVLDDSTSSLDAITEKKVFDQLKGSKLEASFIVIGQKITTIRHMEQILVLHNGEMVGLGGHEELILNCPTYRELYDVQMGVTAHG